MRILSPLLALSWWIHVNKHGASGHAHFVFLSYSRSYFILSLIHKRKKKSVFPFCRSLNFSSFFICWTFLKLLYFSILMWYFHLLFPHLSWFVLRKSLICEIINFSGRMLYASIAINFFFVVKLYIKLLILRTIKCCYN